MTTLLVTGGAGYIGSHAVRALVAAGYDVVVLDNLSKGYRAAVHPKAKLVEMDLGDVVALKNFFKKNRFDAVMHFAGSIEVGLSMIQPELFFNNNLLNGVNLLEAMRQADVKKIIFSSTAAVYGVPKEVPIKESSPLVPTNFYGVSKLMFEQLLQKYAEYYGFSSVALRYFNACGADSSGEIGQDYAPDTHILPHVLKTVLGKYEKVKVFGTDYATPDGTCIRDYVHVTDLVDAHLKALEWLLAGKGSEIFNLGNGNGFSVREVLKMSEEVVGQKIPFEEAPRRAGDPPVLVADASKAKELLGWKPQYSDLKTIIGTAWTWYALHPQGYAKN